MGLNSYEVIGIMSGTSLDGVDILCCHLTPPITKEGGAKNWNYKIIAAQTTHYSPQWKKRLQNLENKSAFEYALTNSDYGHYLGKLVNKFVKKHHLKPDLISSHGHTIFHQPKKKLTTQIGSGAAIAAECGFPVVCDFRTKDVALNGQGAPLVPIGDELLFSDYNLCLNLGGFANISFQKNGKRIAYDICPVNIVMNSIAEKLGKKYDSKGSIARKGKTNEVLLKKLNSLPFYKKNHPKSLGKEWVLETIFPLIKSSKSNSGDVLRTFVEHVAVQIGNTIKKHEIQGIKHKVLITGGGTYNDFLIERIKYHSQQTTVVIPDSLTIEFKEALIFAFLGVLRYREEVNCLSSVTGAKRDNSGGCIYI